MVSHSHKVAELHYGHISLIPNKEKHKHSIAPESSLTCENEQVVYDTI